MAFFEQFRKEWRLFKNKLLLTPITEATFWEVFPIRVSGGVIIQSAVTKTQELKNGTVDPPGRWSYTPPIALSTSMQTGQKKQGSYPDTQRDLRAWPL